MITLEELLHEAGERSVRREDVARMAGPLDWLMWREQARCLIRAAYEAGRRDEREARESTIATH